MVYVHIFHCIKKKNNNNDLFVASPTSWITLCLPVALAAVVSQVLDTSLV